MLKKVNESKPDLRSANHRATIRAYQREAEQLSTDEIIARRAKSAEARQDEIEALEQKLGFDNQPFGYKPESQSVSGTTAYNAWDSPSLRVVDGGSYEQI